MAEEVKVETPGEVPADALVVTKEGGQDKVSLAALLAERKKGEERAEKIRVDLEAKYKPLEAKAQELDMVRADLQTLTPHIQYLKEHPELLKRDEPSSVSDDDADRYARDNDIINLQGQYDVVKAKRMLGKHREEIKRVATEAAQQAVQPAIQATAKQQAQSNYLWALQQKDGEGRPLVDPQILLQKFSSVPAELAANPDVARHLLQTAAGETLMSGKRPTGSPQFEPTFSEPAGGGRQTYQMSDIEKKVQAITGIKSDDWQKTAKTFRPGELNVIGE